MSSRENDTFNSITVPASEMLQGLQLVEATNVAPNMPFQYITPAPHIESNPYCFYPPGLRAHIGNQPYYFFPCYVPLNPPVVFFNNQTNPFNNPQSVPINLNPPDMPIDDDSTQRSDVDIQPVVTVKKTPRCIIHKFLNDNSKHQKKSSGYSEGAKITNKNENRRINSSKYTYVKHPYQPTITSYGGKRAKKYKVSHPSPYSLQNFLHSNIPQQEIKSPISPMSGFYSFQNSVQPHMPVYLDHNDEDSLNNPQTISKKLNSKQSTQCKKRDEIESNLPEPKKGNTILSVESSSKESLNGIKHQNELTKNIFSARSRYEISASSISSDMTCEVTSTSRPNLETTASAVSTSKPNLEATASAVSTSKPNLKTTASAVSTSKTTTSEVHAQSPPNESSDDDDDGIEIISCIIKSESNIQRKETVKRKALYRSSSEESLNRMDLLNKLIKKVSRARSRKAVSASSISSDMTCEVTSASRLTSEKATSAVHAQYASTERSDDDEIEIISCIKKSESNIQRQETVKRKGLCRSSSEESLNRMDLLNKLIKKVSRARSRKAVSSASVSHITSEVTDTGSPTSKATTRRTFMNPEDDEIQIIATYNGKSDSSFERSKRAKKKSEDKSASKESLDDTKDQNARIENVFSTRSRNEINSSLSPDMAFEIATTSSNSISNLTTLEVPTQCFSTESPEAGEIQIIDTTQSRNAPPVDLVVGNSETKHQEIPPADSKCAKYIKRKNKGNLCDKTNKYNIKYLKFPIVAAYERKRRDKNVLNTKIKHEAQKLSLSEVEYRLMRAENNTPQFAEEQGDSVKPEKYDIRESEVECFHRIVGAVPARKLLNKRLKSPNSKMSTVINSVSDEIGEIDQSANSVNSTDNTRSKPCSDLDKLCFSVNIQDTGKNLTILGHNCKLSIDRISKNVERDPLIGTKDNCNLRISDLDGSPLKPPVNTNTNSASDEFGKTNHQNLVKLSNKAVYQTAIYQPSVYQTKKFDKDYVDVPRFQNKFNVERDGSSSFNKQTEEEAAKLSQGKSECQSIIKLKYLENTVQKKFNELLSKGYFHVSNDETSKGNEKVPEKSIENIATSECTKSELSRREPSRMIAPQDSSADSRNEVGVPVTSPGMICEVTTTTNVISKSTIPAACTCAFADSLKDDAIQIVATFPKIFRNSSNDVSDTSYSQNMPGNLTSLGKDILHSNVIKCERKSPAPVETVHDDITIGNLSYEPSSSNNKSLSNFHVHHSFPQSDTHVESHKFLKSSSSQSASHQCTDVENAPVSVFSSTLRSSVSYSSDVHPEENVMRKNKGTLENSHPQNVTTEEINSAHNYLGRNKGDRPNVNANKNPFKSILVQNRNLICDASETVNSQNLVEISNNVVDQTASQKCDNYVDNESFDNNFGEKDKSTILNKNIEQISDKLQQNKSRCEINESPEEKERKKFNKLQSNNISIKKILNKESKGTENSIWKTSVNVLGKSRDKIEKSNGSKYADAKADSSKTLDDNGKYLQVGVNLNLHDEPNKNATVIQTVKNSKKSSNAQKGIANRQENNKLNENIFTKSSEWGAVTIRDTSPVESKNNENIKWIKYPAKKLSKFQENPRNVVLKEPKQMVKLADACIAPPATSSYNVLNKFFETI